MFVTHSSRIEFPNPKCKTVVVECRVTSANNASPPSTALAKEPHKFFDHAVITVRGGDGGHGAVLNQKVKEEKETKNWKKSSFKRDFDGSIVLPLGGHGGDVVVYADESKDTLLEFHNKARFNAKRGGNVDAMGLLTSHLRDGLAAPTLRIAVPLGLFFALCLCFELNNAAMKITFEVSSSSYLWHVCLDQ